LIYHQDYTRGLGDLENEMKYFGLQLIGPEAFAALLKILSLNFRVGKMIFLGAIILDKGAIAAAEVLSINDRSVV